MIESIFEGNKYRFCKDKKQKYWLGISGKGGLFPGEHCLAPVSIWGELQSIAVESGHSKAEFMLDKEEKKTKRTRASKKAKGPSISIF